MVDREAINMIDLKKLTPQMVSSVTLDSDEDTCTVRFSIPTDTGSLEYEEVLFWAKETPSREIKKTAAAFVEMLVEEVQLQRAKTKRVLCETCSGKCCGRHFGTVRVTADDAERFTMGGLDVKKCVVPWDGAPIRRPMLSIDNTIGYVAMVPWRGYSKDPDEQACMFLTNAGCSIYKYRPDACRNFSAFTCDIYEEDPDKTSGRVRLPVVK
jgi:Fe-S-cluster containining protein